MGYRKRKSARVVEQVKIRAAGLAIINPKMDFGSDRSLSNLQTQVDELEAKINAYNAALITIDTLRGEIKERERLLGDLSEQMLIGVAFEYGKNSPEYEMAGGVRKSERVRRSSVARLKAQNSPSEAV